MTEFSFRRTAQGVWRVAIEDEHTELTQQLLLWSPALSPQEAELCTKLLQIGFEFGVLAAQADPQMPKHSFLAGVLERAARCGGTREERRRAWIERKQAEHREAIAAGEGERHVLPRMEDL